MASTSPTMASSSLPPQSSFPSPSSSTTTMPSTTISRSASKKNSIEKPRPLKSASSSSISRLSNFEMSSVENTKSLLENVAHNLNNANYDATVVTAIANLSASLKSWGPHLEVMFKESLDKFQVALRTACRDVRLDLRARLYLLEIIELRAMNWKATESLTNYYKQKLAQVESETKGTKTNKPNFMRSHSAASFVTPVTKSLASSNKKVTTPLINHNKVSNSSNHSKSIEECVEKNERKKKKSEEFQYTINIGQQEVTITGQDDSLVKVAQAVLQKYFDQNKTSTEKKKKDDENNNLHGNEGHKRRRSGGSGGNNNDARVNITRSPLFPDAPKTAFQDVEKSKRGAEIQSKERRAQFAKTMAARAVDVKREKICYDRQTLYEIGNLPCSRSPPHGWDKIMLTFPNIARKDVHPLSTFENPFSKKPYSEHCDREGNTHLKLGYDSRA